MKCYHMILTEKQQKYQLFHLEKLINMNGKQIIELYLFSFRKDFLKTNKIHRRTRKKQIKAIGGQVNKLVESNELIKKNLNINRDSLRFHEQKKINKLVQEKSYEFNNLKDKINASNFIYEFKTEGRIPKI